MGPLPGPLKCPLEFEKHIEYAMILHLTMGDLDERASVEYVLKNYMPIWKEQLSGQRTKEGKIKEEELLNKVRSLLKSTS